MLGAALRTHLISDQTLNSLIGERVYPVILPQKPTLPAMTYQVVSQDPTHTLTTPVALTRPRYQFDIWAQTYLELEAVSDALRGALDGYKGEMGGSPEGVHVQGAFLVTEHEIPGYEGEPQIYRRSSDYFLWIEQ